MSNYAVGLTGLEVARKAIQVIGNNIANAATEGYHRQAPIITPLAGGVTSATQIGRGAEVSDVRRMIDLLLEREIRRQTPQLGQVGQELTTLESLESMLGDLTTGGLAGALNHFFGSLDELASQPESAAFQEQAVWAADSLAAQFRTLGTTISRLKGNALHEARNLADEVNRLAREIADANIVAASVWKRGGTDDNLMDIRDQAVAELAELADVEVQAQQDGSYTVYAWGMPIVVQGRVTEIEVDYADTDTIGVSAAGAHHYNSGLRGGRVGGMLALYNDLLPRIGQDLDTLAGEIIQSHVQGVGTAGSFAELIGWPTGSSPVGEWTAPVTAGDIHLRVVNTATGEVTRRTVTITDPATETVSDIAVLLDAVPNLSSNIADSRLHIRADAGFTFDFLPALVQTPATSTLTGTAEPTLSGVFTGAANETYTCTVVGAGEVGVAVGLAVEVRNGAGELVGTLNVGSGYAAADPLEAAPGSGITLAMSMGTLLGGEQFTVDALADADPTGFLGAAGINTLFSGDSARTMDVVDRVRDAPSLLATTLGTDGTDNLNVLRMADVADAPIAALGDSAPSDAYRAIVSTVGQWVAIRRARHDGLESILGELAGQRDNLSGVDINEEAARLLLFEQMFQAMARYLAAVDEAYQYLMEII